MMLAPTAHRRQRSAVPLTNPLRRLDVELPACPRVLIDLLTLLNDDSAPVHALAACIEADMALAAAVVRTVNVAMFGLLRRVQTVGEAVRYLGTREVAAVTFQTALRAAFPPTPALDAIWQRAAATGLLMGRAASALQLDPFQAHTAGLFARCGQAALFVTVGAPYVQCLQDHANDPAGLLAAEWQQFGVHHNALGSALCAAWGLAPDVVKFVRERSRGPMGWTNLEPPVRRLLGLGAAVDAWLDLGGAAHVRPAAKPAEGVSATLGIAPASAWLEASGLTVDRLVGALRPHLAVADPSD
jgi:HD-like signal output (HDOD) protein